MCCKRFFLLLRKSIRVRKEGGSGERLFGVEVEITRQIWRISQGPTVDIVLAVADEILDPRYLQTQSEGQQSCGEFLAGDRYAATKNTTGGEKVGHLASRCRQISLMDSLVRRSKGTRVGERRLGQKDEDCSTTTLRQARRYCYYCTASTVKPARPREGAAARKECKRLEMHGPGRFCSCTDCRWCQISDASLNQPSDFSRGTRPFYCPTCPTSCGHRPTSYGVYGSFGAAPCFLRHDLSESFLKTSTMDLWYGRLVLDLARDRSSYLTVLTN